MRTYTLTASATICIQATGREKDLGVAIGHYEDQILDAFSCRNDYADCIIKRCTVYYGDQLPDIFEFTVDIEMETDTSDLDVIYNEIENELKQDFPRAFGIHVYKCVLAG